MLKEGLSPFANCVSKKRPANLRGYEIGGGTEEAYSRRIYAFLGTKPPLVEKEKNKECSDS